MMFVLRDRNTALLVFDDNSRATVSVAGLRAVVELADMMAEEADADEGWLTVAEAAKALRAPMSTVRYWCQQGTLRASKHGRRWMMRPSDLAAFMEAGE